MSGAYALALAVLLTLTHFMAFTDGVTLRENWRPRQEKKHHD